jgi:hypothetical protein
LRAGNSVALRYPAGSPCPAQPPLSLPPSPDKARGNSAVTLRSRLGSNFSAANVSPGMLGIAQICLVYARGGMQASHSSSGRRRRVHRALVSVATWPREHLEDNDHLFGGNIASFRGSSRLGTAFASGIPSRWSAAAQHVFRGSHGSSRGFTSL